MAFFLLGLRGYPLTSYKETECPLYILASYDITEFYNETFRIIVNAKFVLSFSIFKNYT